MGAVILPANPAATPSVSAIGDAIYVAAPSTPATIAGTNIIYQEPQGGRAAPVNELTSVQQAILEAVDNVTSPAYWLTEVVIGGQAFNLTVDTGSSDLWVYGPGYTFAPGISNASAVPHVTYDCIAGQSSNCHNQGSFDISYTYGFGASGGLVMDTVNISNAIVPDMGVEVANVSGGYANFTSDGFLGLGFGTLNSAKPQQPTFMERLMPRLPEPIFTVDFIPQEGGNIAQLEFGYINKKKANGNMNTAPVNNASGSWLVEDIAFMIGDPGSGSFIPLNSSMVFDTGGSGQISVDPRILEIYYSTVPGSVLVNDSSSMGISYNFPCNTTLPDLTLYIGNGTAIYRSSLLNTGVVDTATNMCSGPLSSSTKAIGQPGNMGAAFFAYHFVVFNQGVPEVSYAPWLPFPGTPGSPGSPEKRGLWERTTIPEGERGEDFWSR